MVTRDFQAQISKTQRSTSTDRIGSSCRGARQNYGPKLSSPVMMLRFSVNLTSHSAYLRHLSKRLLGKRGFGSRNSPSAGILIFAHPSTTN